MPDHESSQNAPTSTRPAPTPATTATGPAPARAALQGRPLAQQQALVRPPARPGAPARNPASPQGVHGGPAPGAAPAQGMPAPAEDGTLGSKIPKGLGLSSASIAFTIPGKRQLAEGWNDVSTVEDTRVRLSLSQAGLELSMWPGVRIDVQWPLSDVSFSGLSYGFKSANVDRCDLRYTQRLAAQTYALGKARAEITSKFMGLIAGSRLAQPGYDPLADPDPLGTLAALRANMTAAPAGGSEVGASDARAVTAGGRIRFENGVRQSTDAGGVIIDSGGEAEIEVLFDGSAADLADSTDRKIRQVGIRSGAIRLQKDGKDIALLESVRVSHGGQVDVDQFKGLGSLATAQGAESLVRLLGLVFAAGSGNPRAQIGLQTGHGVDLRPEVVDGMAVEQMEEALSQAVRQALRDNAKAIPGVDLARMLGIA